MVTEVVVCVGGADDFCSLPALLHLKTGVGLWFVGRGLEVFFGGRGLFLRPGCGGLSLKSD